MTKVSTSAKISKQVKQEAVKVAKQNKISFSQLVETALIHELNRNNKENGTYAVLDDIKEYIEEKIDNLNIIIEDTTEKIITKDVDYYVNELKEIHRLFGFVSAEAVAAHAKKAGVSYVDFKNILDKDDFVYNITNV